MAIKSSVYGPASGYYSRDSILQARRSGGTKGSRILKVDPSGNAPEGSRIGDYIQTAGGTYLITGGTPGNWSSYNINTGLTGKSPTSNWGNVEDTYAVGGSGRGSIGRTGAITASDYYTKALEEQQKAIQERINQAVAANNAYIPQIQQRSKQALQNAYITKERNLMSGPQVLAALGYTGGASETELNRTRTNYENSRNLIEQERSRALEGIRQNEAQIRATGDATLSEAAASYYDKLVAAALEAERRAQNQANWEAEFALQQKQYEDAAAQQAWKNAYEERLFALRQKEYEDAAAQQAWQNAYDEKLYELQRANAGKTSGTKTYGGFTASQINDLVQSGVMSEDEARALLGFAVAAPTSSGNYNAVWANVQRALGGSNARSQRAFDAVINYIQQSLRSGMITENEALQMLGRLNLL